jgi:chromosome partitioning protein
VLVVDLDPQANATSGLGVAREPGKSIYRALVGDDNVGDLIQGTEVENLKIIPSEVDLAGAEVDVARMDNYLHCFRRAIQPVIDSGVFGYILVDCPPSLGILTINALAAADSILVPMQCEYYAMEGLSVIMQLVQQLRENGTNPGLAIEGVVMTMFDGRTNLSEQVVNEVRAHLPEAVYAAMIPRTVRLSEAPSFGKPVISYDSSSVGAQAYRKLAKEFLKRGRDRSALAATSAMASEEVSREPVPGEAVVPAASARIPEAPPVCDASAVMVPPEPPPTLS